MFRSLLLSLLVGLLVVLGVVVALPLIPLLLMVGLFWLVLRLFRGPSRVYAAGTS